LFLIRSEGGMRHATLPAAFAALFAAGLWQLPATAQHAAAARPQSPPAAAPAAAPSVGQPAATGITFEAYRDYRMHYIADRRARLAQQLAAPGLSADEKARLEGIKAYYDRYAAMPAAERDRLFRARFDQIDTNHDGTIDEAERAAWREKQRQYYSQLTAERAQANGAPH
jgi:hypothetical protein